MLCSYRQGASISGTETIFFSPKNNITIILLLLYLQAYFICIILNAASEKYNLRNYIFSYRLVLIY